MKNEFGRIPEAMQHQVVLRLAVGAGFLFLFLVLNPLPCLLFGSGMIVNGGLLFYNGIKGNFIRVQGICRQIETTGIRKLIKNLYIDMEPYTLKMPVRHRIRNLIRGDTVIIYLSEKTPVYEQDKGYMICSYYALEIKKEV